MKISKAVYDIIISFYPSVPPEQGGMIGIKDGIITHYVHDDSPSKDGFTYIPNIALFNSVIEEWATEGVSFAGIIHSHKSGCIKLSEIDKSYIAAIMRQCNLNELYFPIIIPQQKIYPYLVKFVYEDIYIVEENLYIFENDVMLSE